MPPRTAARLAALVAGACLTASLTGCSGDDDTGPAPYPTPALSGVCAPLQSDLRALAAAAERLGDGPTVPDDVVADLQAAQSGLEGASPSLPPELSALVDRLVTRVGLVRLTAEAERFGPDNARDLRDGYTAVLGGCSASPSATPSG